MEDLYYIEEGYYDAGYFNYTASIDLVAFSNASLTTTASKIVDVNDAYPYTWDDLTTWENFVGNEWLPTGIIVVSAFTLTGDLTKLTGVDVFGSGDWNSETNLTISAERFAGFASELASVVSQSTSISKTVSAVSEMSSSFAQTATISHIHGSDLFAFSDAAIAVQYNRLRDNNIDVSDVFSINLDYIKIIQNQSDLTDTFISSISGERSRESTIGEFGVAFSFVLDFKSYGLRILFYFFF